MRIAGLIFTLCAFSYFSSCTNAKGQATVETLDNKGLTALRTSDPETILLDVRTPEEFLSGSIPDAININWLDSDNFVQMTEKLKKNTPVVVYCMSGMRSAAASAKLTELGFTRVYDLTGGYKSWSE